MVVSPPRRALGQATLARLDRYATDALGCPVDPARAGGVHLLAASARAVAAWHGHALPVLGLSFPEGATLTVRPDLYAALLQGLGSDVHRRSLDRAALERVRRAASRLAPHAFVLAGDMLAADPSTFVRPPGTGRAELIPADDPAALHLRHRFDGPVFGVRGPRGSLISWSALKLKAADVWEVAVATEADYRGRGFARDVVAAATSYTLARGSLCLYVHDHDNRSSAYVARALGYARYAEVVLAEY